jgi:hypothetical protein
MKWLRSLPPFAILAIGWFAFFVHAYPGLMTRDSFDQLRQARSGFFLDDHPPLMQAIVSLTDPLIPGPTGVVVAQSIMLLAGAYLVLRRALRPRVAALVAVGFLLFPPVLAVMVVMWKDPMMAGALLLATGLVLSPSRPARLASLALVLVANGVRFNGLAATFAIVVLLFEWRAWGGTKWMQRAKRYGLALGVWTAVTAASFAVNTALTDKETHFWHTTLVDDIVGTLRYGEPRSDEELREALAGTHLRFDTNIYKQLRNAYRSDTMLWLVLGEKRVFDLPLADVEPPPPELRAALIRAWKTIVMGDFGAFMRYRADRFRLVLGLTFSTKAPDERAWDAPIIVTHEFQDKARLAEYGVSTTSSGLQDTIDGALSWLSHTWLFRPWIYLVLSFVLLAFSLRNQLAAALLLSGIGMELSLFFLAHSSDYRYSHWMICTTLLAAILVFTDRLRGNQRRP